jgi:valyl-tRNA synthetase
VSEIPEAAIVAGTGVLDVVAPVLSEIRRAKTAAKVSMRARVAKLTVVDDPARLALLLRAEDDLRAAGGVAELVTRSGPFEVIVELEPPTEA